MYCSTTLKWVINPSIEHTKFNRIREAGYDLGDCLGIGLFGLD